MCGWKAPQVLLCAHSPQLVWVDVDPGWEAAAARDKAQEAAPVLWVKEEKINLTPALAVREVLQLVSRLKSCPKAMQAALCPLLTIGEIVQSLPKVLHPCVRRFKVLEPSWRGPRQESILRSHSARPSIPPFQLHCPVTQNSLSLRRASTVTSGSPHTFFSNSCQVSKSSTACGTTFSRPACMAAT